MRVFFLTGLSALLLAPIARGTAGDDAFAALSSGNNARALSLARPAAENGDFMAQYVLGNLLMMQGAERPEVEKWLKQASVNAARSAQAGDPRAEYILGRFNFDMPLWETDNAKALNWFRASAEHGYAPAQFHLGHMYGFGLGTALDHKAEAAWYRKAAEQGHAHAQYCLGSSYQRGEGVGQNPGTAASWYRKAARQGHDAAQYELGAMHEQGSGVAQDYKAAAAWYRKAAEAGNPKAQADLGALYLRGLGVGKDEKLAAEWSRKAAEQGNAPAQANLGAMYQQGWGVPQNDKEAAAWYQKAAENGIASAQSMLGWMYHQGVGVPQDNAQAEVWYLKAAERGDATAKQNLAALTVEGNEAPAPAVRAEAPAAPKSPRSDVDTPGYSSPENPANFAVVVGVERYASLPAAEFAERDAESVRAHLMALGTPARNIFFLSGQLATRAKIAQALNTWLPNRVGADSTVFFYYSGHGAPDVKTGQAYLVPSDGDPEDLDSTAYPVRQVYEKLGKLKAKSVIVALDSCFSGAGGRSVLAKGTRPLVVSVEAAELPERVVALTASDNNQISGTIEEQGHGAFTYYLLKGLSSDATVQSLYGYLTPKVQDAARLQNRDQTPQLLPAAARAAASPIRMR